MTLPLIARIRRWVMDRIVQDVPEAVAACEFDCREPKCTHTASTPCSIRTGARKAPAAHTCIVIPFPTAARARSIAARARHTMGNASR
jgi:hypothetical protein